MKERKNVTHEYKNINTKELLVDDMYQRDLDPKRVSRIVKKFDPCLANAIKVSYRDGKYWIFDGNHTKHAMKTVYAKGRDLAVECKVFYGLSRVDEMELFLAQNGESSPVRKAAKLKALFRFGDEDVVDMVRDTEKAGVRLDFTTAQAVNKITAYSTIQRVYMRFKAHNQRKEYIDMLTVLHNAWDGIPASFMAEVIRGASKFFEVYAGTFKLKDLENSLSRISPVQIIREGKALSTGTTTDETYARIILRTYNTGRRSNRLEDRL